MQLSNSGRVVQIVCVSQGRVFFANAGDQAWTEATNMTGSTPPLNFSGLVYSTACNQLLFFADGTNAQYYRPSDGTVQPWNLTAGQFPADSQNNFPRLICTWRGRVVQSGLINDPQNWFMSAVSNPFDYDYAPLSVTPTQAIAGNNAPTGLIGDVVTALCPFSDDVLIVGSDHQIYMFNGDPMAGGSIDRISDSIGMAWGQAFCRDPYGTLYFFSNKCGVYSYVPGQQPQRISQQIEQLLLDIDTGANGITMIWEDRAQGFHIFVSPLIAPATTTHFFWDARSGAWWTDQFGNSNHDPLACAVFDGNTPGDRAILIGSWDGYVRFFDPAATKDDGTNIASSVVIGPMLTKDLDDLLAKDMQAVLGISSGKVSYAVYVGNSAEQALQNDPIITGTWGPGRNLTNLVRFAGHGIYVKLTASTPWSMESIRFRLAAQGKVRRRGF